MKTNPEIMELKYGCEVVVEFENGELDKGTIIKPWSDMYHIVWEGGYEDVEIRDLKQILDRPIHLADILLAIGHGYSV